MRTVRCKICGKQGCETCFFYLFSVVGRTREGHGQESAEVLYDSFFVCSQHCIEIIGEKLAEGVPTSALLDMRSPLLGNAEGMLRRVLLDGSYSNWMKDERMARILGSHPNAHFGHPYMGRALKTADWKNVVLGKIAERQLPMVLSQLKQSSGIPLYTCQNCGERLEVFEQLRFCHRCGSSVPIGTLLEFLNTLRRGRAHISRVPP